MPAQIITLPKRETMDERTQRLQDNLDLATQAENQIISDITRAQALEKQCRKEVFNLMGLKSKAMERRMQAQIELDHLLDSVPGSYHLR